MTVGRLHHVSVTCADLDRSLAFYGDLLGLPVRARGVADGEDVARVVGMPGARLRFAEVDLGEGRIVELLEYVAPHGERLAQTTADPGSAHFAFEVDDAEAIHARLVAAGVVCRSAPVTLEDDDPNWAGVRVFYAVDPDGFTVEFVELPRP